MATRRYRDLLTRRSSAQGVVNRHINSLTRIIAEPGTIDRGTCGQLYDKLIAAKDRYDGAHADVLELAFISQIDTGELEDGAYQLSEKFLSVCEKLKPILSGQESAPRDDLLVEVESGHTSPADIALGDTAPTDGVTSPLSRRAPASGTPELRKQLRLSNDRHLRETRDLRNTIDRLREELELVKISMTRDSRAASSPTRDQGRRVTFGPGAPSVLHPHASTEDLHGLPTGRATMRMDSNKHSSSGYSAKHYNVIYVNGDDHGNGDCNNADSPLDLSLKPMNSMSVNQHNMYVRDMNVRGDGCDAKLHSTSGGIGVSRVVTGAQTPMGTAVGPRDDRSYGWGAGGPTGQPVDAHHQSMGHIVGGIRGGIGYHAGSLGAGVIHEADTQGGGPWAGLHRSYLDQSAAQHRSLVATMRAPHVKLSTFDGEPLNYASFFHAFDDLVDAVHEDPRTKLSLLLSHCSGHALDMIKSCAYGDATEGYRKARHILQSRFGSPFVVSQAWLGKLMAHPTLRTPAEFEAFYADLSCCRDTLRSLGFVSELECTNSIRLIVAKLPVHVRNRWRKTYRGLRDQPQSRVLTALVELVGEASDDINDPAFSELALENIRNTYMGSLPSSRHQGKNSVRRENFHVVGDGDMSTDPGHEAEVHYVKQDKSTCALCSSSRHFTSKCPKYRSLPPSDKLSTVKSKRLCLLCLGEGHSASECRLPWKCQERGCSRRHHTSLHQAFADMDTAGGSETTEPATKTPVNLIDLEDPEQESNHDPHVDQCYLTSSAPSLPLTAVVVRNGEDSVATYALLDTGSSITLCSSGLATRLGLSPVGETTLNLGTVVGNKEVRGDIVRCDVAPADGTNFLPIFEAVTIDRLPVSLDHIAAASELAEWAHLRDLRLPVADADSVDLLIGMNNAHLLEPQGKVKGSGEYDPYAVRTPLGWTIYGNLRRPGGADRTGHTFLTVNADIIPDHIEDSIDRLCRLEAIPAASKFTPDEQHVLDLWESTYEVIDGKIVIPIPFRKEPPGLPDNYGMAVSSLNALGRRLLRNPKELQQYRTAIQTNITEGFSEPVDLTDPVEEGYVWYLLHHGVEHHRKPDVTRVVKNGSAKFKGVSLNDLVYPGPDLMNRLIAVLLRFRQYLVATCGDVEGMFNHVKVVPIHRDCLRYLFWEDGDPSKKIVVYRMTTHIFGTAWAPAAAMWALRKIADLFATGMDPRVKQSILDDFYVDDWQNSEPSVAVAKSLTGSVIEVLGSGGFNLRKFTGNNREVLHSIETKRRAAELAKIDIFADRIPQQFSLGVGWYPDIDAFFFSVGCEPRPQTRRGLMSCVSGLFDPLGLVAPFVLPAKQLLRQVCRAGTRWDDPLPPQHC